MYVSTWHTLNNCHEVKTITCMYIYTRDNYNSLLSDICQLNWYSSVIPYTGYFSSDFIFKNFKNCLTVSIKIFFELYWNLRLVHTL